MTVMANARPVGKTQLGQPRAQRIDRHVGVRMRDRRILLGISQQQVAEQIGVTPQQAQKYEKGSNRTSAGRLYAIAQVLGVDVRYFFEGLDINSGIELTPKERRLLALARNFMSLTNQEHQEAICSLARMFASGEDLIEQATASQRLTKSHR